MGNRLFGEDIAGELWREMKALGVPALILTTVVQNEPTAGHLAAGANPSYVDSPVDGIVESYEERDVDGNLILSGDRRFLIFGDSLPEGTVPRINDRITDTDGLVYTIVSKPFADADKAIWTCQGRGRSGQ